MTNDQLGIWRGLSPILWNSIWKAHLLLMVGLLTVGLLGPQQCKAIHVTTLATDAELDRYLNDAAFLSAVPTGSTFDFTGVGQGGAAVGESGVSKWATMIGPTTFLSATHSHPALGSTVTFRDDGGSVLASHTVAGGFALSNSDLWVGELTSAVDQSRVAVYDVAVPTATWFLGADVVQVGVGGTSPQFRVGQNELDTIIFSDPDVVNQSVFSVYLDNSATGGLNSEAGQELDSAKSSLLDYETYFQGGDSGGPTFFNDGSGELRLLGIHSWVGEFSTDYDAEDERRGSVDVFLPYYHSQIQAAIPSIAATAVPEPSAFLGLLLFALLYSSRRYSISSRSLID